MTTSADANERPEYGAWHDADSFTILETINAPAGSLAQQTFFLFRMVSRRLFIWSPYTLLWAIISALTGWYVQQNGVRLLEASANVELQPLVGLPALGMFGVVTAFVLAGALGLVLVHELCHVAFYKLFKTPHTKIIFHGLTAVAYSHGRVFTYREYVIAALAPLVILTGIGFPVAVALIAPLPGVADALFALVFANAVSSFGDIALINAQFMHARTSTVFSADARDDAGNVQQIVFTPREAASA